MYVRLRKYDAEMLLPSIPLAVTQEPERIDFNTKNSFRKYWANKNELFVTSKKSERTLP